jgi:hypothetical protein
MEAAASSRLHELRQENTVDQVSDGTYHVQKVIERYQDKIRRRYDKSSLISELYFFLLFPPQILVRAEKAKKYRFLKNVVGV